MLILFSDNIVRLASAKVWMLDGTFGTAPQGFKQMYSVLACVGTGESARFLPLVYFLLQSKSEETYTEALQMLNDVAAEKNTELEPDMIITDYEMAAINAVEVVFPESQAQGCFFHLCQNFYKRIQSYGLVSLYLKNREIYMAFKKTEALAFLPPNTVPAAFIKLRQTAPEEMDKFFQ